MKHPRSLIAFEDIANIFPRMQKFWTPIVSRCDNVISEADIVIILLLESLPDDDNGSDRPTVKRNGNELGTESNRDTLTQLMNRLIKYQNDVGLWFDSRTDIAILWLWKTLF